MKEIEIPFQKQEYEDVTPYPPLSLFTYSELIKSKQTFLLLYTALFAYLIKAMSKYPRPGGLRAGFCLIQVFPLVKTCLLVLSSLE